MSSSLHRHLAVYQFIGCGLNLLLNQLWRLVVFHIFICTPFTEHGIFRPHLANLAEIGVGMSELSNEERRSLIDLNKHLVYLLGRIANAHYKAMQPKYAREMRKNRERLATIHAQIKQFIDGRRNRLSFAGLTNAVSAAVAEYVDFEKRWSSQPRENLFMMKDGKEVEISVDAHDEPVAQGYRPNKEAQLPPDEFYAFSTPLVTHVNFQKIPKNERRQSKWRVRVATEKCKKCLGMGTSAVLHLPLFFAFFHFTTSFSFKNLPISVFKPFLGGCKTAEALI